MVKHSTYARQNHRENTPENIDKDMNGSEK